MEAQPSSVADQEENRSTGQAAESRKEETDNSEDEKVFFLSWDGVSVLELEFSCDHIRLAFVRYLRCLMHLSKWNVPEGLGLRLIPAWLG